MASAKRKASCELTPGREGVPIGKPEPDPPASSSAAPGDSDNPIEVPSSPNEPSPPSYFSGTDSEWDNDHGDVDLCFDEGPNEQYYAYLRDSYHDTRLGQVALFIDDLSVKAEVIVRKLARLYGLIIPDEGHKFTYVLLLSRCERVEDPSLLYVIDDFLENHVQTHWDEDRKDWKVGVRFNVRRWVPKYRTVP